jgi:hypothetical protein
MKKLVGILSAALLVTAGIGTNLWLQHRGLRKQIDVLQARVTARHAASAAPLATGRVEELETLDLLEAAPLTAQQRDWSSTLRAMQGRPEDRDIRRARLQLEMLPMLYPDLATAMQLTPDEATRLLELIATLHLEDMEDIRVSAGNGSFDSAAAEDGRHKAQAAQQLKAARLAALLGDKYPQWVEYEKTASSRRQVKQLQAVLGSGAIALGAARAKALIAVLAAEQASIDHDLRQMIAGGIDPDDFRRRKFDAESRRLPEAASPHLTPAQLVSVRRVVRGFCKLLPRISRPRSRTPTHECSPARRLWDHSVRRSSLLLAKGAAHRLPRADQGLERFIRRSARW